MGVQRNRWSPAARIIGFDGPKISWALCDGVPFCLAPDRLRPANDAKLLAYQMIHHQELMPRGTQQSYIDYTRPVEEENEEGDEEDDQEAFQPDLFHQHLRWYSP